jgi:hypothetical protein
MLFFVVSYSYDYIEKDRGDNPVDLSSRLEQRGDNPIYNIYTTTINNIYTTTKKHIYNKYKTTINNYSSPCLIRPLLLQGKVAL